MSASRITHIASTSTIDADPFSLEVELSVEGRMLSALLLGDERGWSGAVYDTAGRLLAQTDHPIAEYDWALSALCELALPASCK
jgi:hypothetical protein